MNGKLIIFISVAALSFCFLNFKSITDSNTPNELYQWSQNKLTWELFKSEHPPTGFQHYHAVTVTTQKLENYYFDNDSISFDIICYFDIRKSWKSEIITSNIDLLNHEQRHFDLHEIFTRKLRKKLTTLSFPEKPETFTWKIDQYKFKLRNDFLEITSVYDMETKHGTITDKQKEWDSKIDSMLLTLNEYAKTRVVKIRR